jgi:bacterioferritin-associated ferredoxin
MRKQVIGYVGILLALVLALTTINCQSSAATTAAPKQCPLAAMGVTCVDDDDDEPGKVCPITQGKDPCDGCVTKAKELQGQNEIEKLDAQFTRHLAAKEYDKALDVISRIDKALPANPKIGFNPQVVNAKAYIYMQKPDYDKALESYNQLLKAWPNDAGSLYNVTCIYSLKDKKSVACEYLGKAVQAGYYDWEHMDKDTDLNNIRNEAVYKTIRASLQAKNPVIKRVVGCGGDCSTCPSQVKEAVHSHSHKADCANCTQKNKCDSAGKCAGGESCKCGGHSHDKCTSSDKCNKDGKCAGTCTEQKKANCPMHKK